MITVHGMLDLETLSTRPNAVILTLGIVKFDPFSDFIDIESGLNIRVDVDEQTKLGRDIQEETLIWWEKQPADVRDDALSDNNRICLDEFTKALNKFLVGVDQIWCQGPVFDIAILENLYYQLGKPTPWQFWQIRDSRTLFGVHGDPREKGRKAAHNALMDSYYQAIGVQQIYQQLGLKPRNQK